MAEPSGNPAAGDEFSAPRYAEWLVVLVAALVFLGCIVSPPSLMDDVDAVQAQIARNMLDSGDWVTARLDGIAYLEKAPLKYWMIAVSYMVFGTRDWAARIPVALSAILLCWVTTRMGRWAFGPAAGFYAGLTLATCAGLFLFTRILIPDVTLTLAVTLSLWAFLRLLEEGTGSRNRWWFLLWASIGCGFLLKGLIAIVFPAGAVFVYLVLTRQFFAREAWIRLRPLSGVLVTAAIAAPWVIAATVANPPYFDFTMHSAPGEYHGFFWFFFLNEHLFRFLNMRYPRDYNTVPRVLFWLFHLLWLFPWSAYFPAAARTGFRPVDRAGRMRLLALCWSGFLMVFFTFSTTQEYYSMPIYPALALLIGCAIAGGGRWVRTGTHAVAALATVLALLLGSILFLVRDLPAPGDISRALTLNPDAYTLSLGHMRDLTLPAFAYLRLPLLVATLAMIAGAAGTWLLRGRNAIVAIAAMMVLFFHAARLALVVFDPYLSSRPLAEALKVAPKAEIIFDNQYYAFSSVFFYADVKGWLLNGRVNNLEYGSYAPGAPGVFLDDAQFAEWWNKPKLYYLVVEGVAIPRIAKLVDLATLHIVRESGGKFLLANQSIPGVTGKTLAAVSPSARE